MAVSAVPRTGGGEQLQSQKLTELIRRLHGLVVLSLSDLPRIQHLLDLLPRIAVEVCFELSESLSDIILRHHLLI